MYMYVEKIVHHSVAAMVYFCRPTRTFASSSLAEKANGIFSSVFLIVAENKLCVQQDNLHK